LADNGSRLRDEMKKKTHSQGVLGTNLNVGIHVGKKATAYGHDAAKPAGKAVNLGGENVVQARSNGEWG